MKKMKSSQEEEKPKDDENKSKDEETRSKEENTKSKSSILTWILIYDLRLKNKLLSANNSSQWCQKWRRWKK